uniref:Uncharacterized protein n=1 Tax=Romanomermis culicivorax TaxID=13658 RepID=A0A915IPQ7_ROMCU
MTVVFSDHEFYLLDDLKYYAAIYNDLKLCYKIELYDISEPFLMQSEVNSINARILSKEETSHEQIIKKRKKKTRKSAPNENCLFVERHFQDIISKCRAAGFLKNDSSAVQRLLTGNKIAKDVFKSVADRLNVDGPNDILNVPIEKCDNWLEKSKIIDLSEKDYILPGCSSFIQSDVIEGLNMISRDKLKFDIVVIDPPWTNKSVRRKR